MNRQDRLMQRSHSERVRRGDKDIQVQDQSKIRGPGWKMTDSQYGEYKKYDKEFNETISKRNQALNKAQGQVKAGRSALAKGQSQIDAGYDQLGDANIKSAYGDYKKSFKKIRVVDGKNGWNVEKTYYLPKEIIDNLNATSFTGQEGSYYGAWNKDGGYSVDVNVRGGGARGAELHKSLGDAQTSVQAAFYKQNSGAIDKAKKEGAGQLSDASSALGTSRADLDSGQASIDEGRHQVKLALNKRKGEEAILSSDYQTGLAGRQKHAAVRSDAGKSRYRQLSADKANQYK